MMQFWYGLLLSSLLAPFIFKLLIAMKSRQTVSAHAPEGHQVKQGTPTMGGLLIVIPFLLLAPFLILPPDPLRTTNALSPYTPHPIWPQFEFLVATFALIGFVDDYIVPRLMKGKRGLGWKQKLVMQLVASLIYSVIAKHHGVEMAVDALVILAASNAYNFADGLDGLAISILGFMIPGLMFISPGSVSTDTWLLLGGAAIPFACLNAPKAKVFMGDVGSLPIGALIGAFMASTLSDVHTRLSGGFSVSLAVACLSLVLLAELLPVPMQIFWVKVFKRKLFPFTPIHHAFEKAGWPETRVVATFAIAQLLCTMGAISILVNLS